MITIFRLCALLNSISFILFLLSGNLVMAGIHCIAVLSSLNSADIIELQNQIKKD